MSDNPESTTTLLDRPAPLCGVATYRLIIHDWFLSRSGVIVSTYTHTRLTTPAILLMTLNLRPLSPAAESSFIPLTLQHLASANDHHVSDNPKQCSFIPLTVWKPLGRPRPLHDLLPNRSACMSANQRQTPPKYLPRLCK